MPDAPKLKEIISPEGVEERVESEQTFRITLTGGGKYRVYSIVDGELDSKGVFEDKKAAQNCVATGMMLLGALVIDPVKTLEVLGSALERKTRGEH